MFHTTIFVSVLFLFLLNLSPAHSQNDLNFEFVKRVKDRHEDSFFQLGDVCAVGVGKEGNHYVIDVYADSLKRSLIPTQKEGVRVRLNESGPFSVAAAQGDCNQRATFPPSNIPIGVSTGNTTETGTLGFRVVRPGPLLGSEVVGTYGYTTCNHVAAGQNGCWNRKLPGEPQFQPGKLDNPFGNQIGQLEDYVYVVTCGCNSPTFPNEVDAAFVKMLSATTVSTEICDVGLHTRMPRVVDFDLKVIKSGRRTLRTEGFVVNVASTVLLGSVGCGRAKFVNQIIVSDQDVTCGRFVDGGDSGAPVVDEFRNPVGMVIGKFTLTNNRCQLPPTRGIITPIQPILDALGVRLY